MNINTKNKKGFTLIEVVISMVIIAIIMYAVISVFITAGVRGVNVEVFTIAQSLAEGKLEEIMSKPYADIVPSGGDFGGDLTQYQYQVEVDFVLPDNFDLEPPLGESQGYKRIEVLIDHPNLENTIVLKSVRADYED